MPRALRISVSRAGGPRHHAGLLAGLLHDAAQPDIDGTHLGERIRALAEVLGPVLPHSADDVNELPDGIES